MTKYRCFNPQDVQEYSRIILIEKNIYKRGFFVVLNTQKKLCYRFLGKIKKKYNKICSNISTCAICIQNDGHVKVITFLFDGRFIFVYLEVFVEIESRVITR